jgi:CelD/BcsL family acetyltransferase involved in cellulose biosynthesis
MSAFGEIVSAARALEYVAPWRDLAARAEPNAFAEFEFVGPALSHFGGARVALVWASASRESLLAVAALTAPPLWMGFARVWRHEQAALPALLIDRSAGEAALVKLRGAVQAAFPFAAGFVIPDVAADAVVASVGGGVKHAAFHAQRRAAYDVAAPQAPNPRRRKEWARLERRLAERGRFEARVANDAAAVERFLALEANGWKGARGTALVQAPERAAFVRDMTAAFRASGRLAVHELTLDDATIASGLLLRSGRRAFFWKTAYDEAFAGYSPGVLLTNALTRQVSESGEVDIIDSCAAPDHPMIDHVWPGRLDFVDLAIAIGSSPLFEAWLAFERAAPKLRERAKRWLLPLMRRKRG